jgi:hypothetical protein
VLNRNEAVATALVNGLIQVDRNLCRVPIPVRRSRKGPHPSRSK